MKSLLFALTFIIVTNVKAQVILDLAVKKGNTQTVMVKESTIILMNCSTLYNYIVDWDFIQNKTPLFKINEGEDSEEACGDEFDNIVEGLKNEIKEDSVKYFVDLGNAFIQRSENIKCIGVLKGIIASTQNSFAIPYAPLKNNQIITITVTKLDKETGKAAEDGKWTFILKTPEKSRWLVHYGLTYTPSIISKTDHYYALADTSVANKFTVTKENSNGPKPWENISATINFTYPFHADPKGFDLGFTAGFGLSAGLELSGQAGLSMIIGDNVILGSGIVMMQKYKLRGRYSNGQIIKDNQDFAGLHEKEWLPELFFTLGFRFGNNPFAKKAAESAAAAPAEAPPATAQP